MAQTNLDTIDTSKWLTRYGKIHPSPSSITDPLDVIYMGIWWGFWVYTQLEDGIPDTVAVAMDAAWRRIHHQRMSES